jgi:hypothetical protein
MILFFFAVVGFRSLWFESYARMVKEFVRRSTYLPLYRYLGDVRRVSGHILCSLYVVLHGTRTSDLRYVVVH